MLKSSYTETPLTQPESSHPPLCAHSSALVLQHLACLQVTCVLCGPYAKSLQLRPTLCYPVDCKSPGSSVHGILKQEYCNELPFPPPGHLPDPGIKPSSLMSPALAGRFFTTYGPVLTPTHPCPLATRLQHMDNILSLF